MKWEFENYVIDHYAQRELWMAELKEAGRQMDEYDKEKKKLQEEERQTKRDNFKLICGQDAPDSEEEEEKEKKKINKREIVKRSTKINLDKLEVNNLSKKSLKLEDKAPEGIKGLSNQGIFFII